MSMFPGKVMMLEDHMFGLFLFRFWKHVFDQPGEQSEEAINCIVKAFKWRKEFGVDKIDEKNINMKVVNKGFMYSHNRDKVEI